MCVPLLYFITLFAGKCKFFRALVLYGWISLLKLNICLLLIMYKTNERVTVTNSFTTDTLDGK
jgi:hypothetical protein